MKRLLMLPPSATLRICLPCGGPIVAFVILMMVAYVP
jgi:hypothetical protein